jgi:uncharacterized protein YutE (UPF0331/DUF86 family)
MELMDSWEKFGKFMESFAAACELDARSATQGCFVECVVLSAAIIDALLRMGLILQHQIDTKSNSLIDELLHQGETDKAISERQIYKSALAQRVISREIFDELNSLYDRRNRVIHRYVISLITTKDVLDIASEYDDLKRKVTDLIANLEKEQIRLGVGMTANAETDDETGDILDLALGKHGDDRLAEALRNNIQ